MQGVFLMVVGMLVTFVFLEILVVVVTLISKIAAKFFPEPEEPMLGGSARVDAEAELAVSIAAVAARLNK